MQPYLVFATSLVLWATLFAVVHYSFISRRISRVYVTLPHDKRVLFDSHIVSNLHVAVALYGGVTCYFSDGCLYDPFLSAFNTSARRDVFLMITAGYLCFDLGLCLRFRDTFGDALMLTHHLLIMIAFFLGVATHIGTFYMASFLVNEASTIFYNLNHFLSIDPEWKQLWVYKANGILLAVSFLIFRIAFNGYNLYLMATHSWWNLAVKRKMWRTEPLSKKILCTTLSLLAIGHVVINFIWFAFIVRAARRKLFRKNKELKAS